MSFLIPTSQQAHAGLRAMKTALTAARALDPSRRAGLDAVQKHLLRTDFDIDALQPITPAELSDSIEPKALREQLMNGMATLVLTGSTIDPKEQEAMEGYARALDVHPSSVDQVRMLIEERSFMLKLDVVRKGPAAMGMKALYEEQGALGVMKNVASFAGLWENAELAARYRGLASYAEGTLGRALYDFYTSHNFNFPGEKRGVPEPVLVHDLTHILSGNGTDFSGEARTLSFQAGYRRENPFGILVFLLVTIQHGVTVTPLAPAQRGLLETTPGLVDEMASSFARGSRMSVDLMDKWDFWAVMDRPVEELRARYGIEAWKAAA